MVARKRTHSNTVTAKKPYEREVSVVKRLRLCMWNALHSFFLFPHKLSCLFFRWRKAVCLTRWVKSNARDKRWRSCLTLCIIVMTPFKCRYIPKGSGKTDVLICTYQKNSDFKVGNYPSELTGIYGSQWEYMWHLDLKEVKKKHLAAYPGLNNQTQWKFSWISTLRCSFFHHMFRWVPAHYSRTFEASYTQSSKFLSY